jgi:hypothetical protein
VAACVHPIQDREPYIDGIYYVSSLHSLYVDGDVDLSNEAEHHPWLQWYSYRMSPAPRGLRNPFPIGPSLLWWPFYFVYDVASQFLGGAGITAESGPVAAPAYFGTTFWVVIGFFLVADLLRLLGASMRARIAIAGIIALASPLPAYVLYAPDMGHGCSFATVALLLWTSVWSWRSAHLSSVRWLVCGLALGLAFTVRWQDALTVVIPVTLLIDASSSASTRPVWLERVQGIFWLGLGGLVGSLPQLFYWKALYGSWLTIPQGGSFLSAAHAEPFAFLFSTWNGVFLSHPLLLLATLGVFAPPRRATDPPWLGSRSLQVAICLVLLLELVSCMGVRDWWAGGSFGQRRVVSLLPVFALGAAALPGALELGRSAARRRAFGAVCTFLLAWNVLSLARLYDGSVPYNPADANWYASGVVYERYAYGRYFADLLFSQGGRLVQPSPADP